MIKLGSRWGVLLQWNFCLELILVAGMRGGRVPSLQTEVGDAKVVGRRGTRNDVARTSIVGAIVQLLPFLDIRGKVGSNFSMEVRCVVVVHSILVMNECSDGVFVAVSLDHAIHGVSDGEVVGEGSAVGFILGGEVSCVVGVFRVFVVGLHAVVVVKVDETFSPVAAVFGSVPVPLIRIDELDKNGIIPVVTVHNGVAVSMGIIGMAAVVDGINSKSGLGKVFILCHVVKIRFDERGVITFLDEHDHVSALELRGEDLLAIRKPFLVRSVVLGIWRPFFDDLLAAVVAGAAGRRRGGGSC